MVLTPIGPDDGWRAAHRPSTEVVGATSGSFAKGVQGRAESGQRGAATCSGSTVRRGDRDRFTASDMRQRPGSVVSSPRAPGCGPGCRRFKSHRPPMHVTRPAGISRTVPPPFHDPRRSGGYGSCSSHTAASTRRCPCSRLVLPRCAPQAGNKCEFCQVAAVRRIPLRSCVRWIDIRRAVPTCARQRTEPGTPALHPSVLDCQIPPAQGRQFGTFDWVIAGWCGKRVFRRDALRADPRQRRPRACTRQWTTPNRRCPILGANWEQPGAGRCGQTR